jgi:hypothetical protein
MKRDWDVVRKILLAIEDLPDRKSVITENDVEHVDSDNVYHHALILIEAGYVVGNEGSRQGGKSVFINRLTWQGHELLDSIRQQSKWNDIKRYAREHSIELTSKGIELVLNATR